jgi:uncharacterized protein YjbI with pentapeptide repeats
MKQEELEKLLVEHRSWLSNRSLGAQLKLTNEDLSGMNLAGCWFSSAILENVDLTGANLQGSEFDRAELKGVRFCKANMEKADVSDSDMSNVDFTNANLTGLRINGLVNATNLKFDGATMDEAFFVKSTFTDCSFKKASLKSANFKRAYFDKCSFQGANLESVDFTHTYLINVDFRESRIENTIFERTRIGPIHVYGMTGKPAIIESCSPEDVDFSEAGDNSDIRLIEDERLIFSQSLSAQR